MTKRERQFVMTVWDFWRASGRHTLPWRNTTDPYHILVSEIMLQQTQVERVLTKYDAFLKKFPTVQKLATAPLGEVLKTWQGLGYNRRAKMLHQCAKAVVSEYAGTFPHEYEELKALPGIGPYTAGAICAFAFNQATPLIETNIRTVYLHHFFKNQEDVSDAALLKYIEKTLDHKRPREWYSALMDYGTHLKKTYGNQNKRSQAYTKQSTFAGSDRQIRGAIIRMLATTPMTPQALKKTLAQFESRRVSEQVEKLLREEMVVTNNRRLQLP